MPIARPFNFTQWITDNRLLLRPPIGNQQVYLENEDFIVMVVGGPNSRTDFHYNEGEELFYQVEGDIVLKIVEEGQVVDIPIREGEMFLLPPRVPHSPRRPANTVGLVIERYRRPGEQDGFLWHCENCGQELFRHFEEITDIVSQLPPIMERFWSNPDHTTCAACGTRMTR